MSKRGPMANGEFSVVRLPHEIDLSNGDEVLNGLFSTIEAGGSHLVVDAREVCFMDCSGLNTLVSARARAESLDGSFHLITGSLRLRRLLVMTRLERVLRRVDTVEAAVACLATPSSLHVCGPLQPPV